MQIRTNANIFWQIMGIFRPRNKSRIEGIYVIPYPAGARNGALLACSTRVRAAFVEDPQTVVSYDPEMPLFRVAEAQINRRIYVPRPFGRLPVSIKASGSLTGAPVQLSFLIDRLRFGDASDLVTINIEDQVVNFQYRDRNGKPKTSQSELPPYISQPPDWKNFLENAEIAPMSAIEGAISNHRFQISNRSMQNFIRAFGRDFQQFIIHTETGPIWGAIGRSNFLLLESPVIRPTINFQKEDGPFDFRKLPQANESDLTIIKHRIQDLII